MKFNFQRSEIEKCFTSPWDLGNKVLYDICTAYPNHKNDEAIIAKTWLIGRAYAVALERRKNKEADEINDDFYEKRVVDLFKSKDLDSKIDSLRSISKIGASNIHQILETHKYLVDMVHGISGAHKRSFASKYLHFHLPKAFFIYDSRASKAINRFSIDTKGIEIPAELNTDHMYAQFAFKCLLLRDKIADETGLQLDPRQLDNFLLRIVKTKN
jgi:hypothetical protein